MIDPTTPDADAEQPAIDDDESLPELFARVVADAKAVARAEVELVRAHAVRWLVEGRMAAFLGVAAVLLIQAAVITALVGLVGILSIHVGIAWATVIVVVGALIVSAILARLALNRIDRIIDPEHGSPS